MANAETIKEAIAQAAVEAAKAMIVKVNEEIRTQAMDTGHHNALEVIRLWTGSPSLKQLVFDQNTQRQIHGVEELTN